MPTNKTQKIESRCLRSDDGSVAALGASRDGSHVDRGSVGAQGPGAGRSTDDAARAARATVRGRVVGLGGVGRGSGLIGGTTLAGRGGSVRSGRSASSGTGRSAVSYGGTGAGTDDDIAGRRELDLVTLAGAATVSDVGFEDLGTLAPLRVIASTSGDVDLAAAHVHLTVADLVEPGPGNDGLSGRGISRDGVGETWERVLRVGWEVAGSGDRASTLEGLDDGELRAPARVGIVGDGDLAGSTSVDGTALQSDLRLRSLGDGDGRARCAGSTRVVRAVGLEGVGGLSRDGPSSLHDDVRGGKRDNGEEESGELGGELHLDGFGFVGIKKKEGAVFFSGAERFKGV